MRQRPIRVESYLSKWERSALALGEGQRFFGYPRFAPSPSGRGGVCQRREPSHNREVATAQGLAAS